MFRCAASRRLCRAAAAAPAAPAPATESRGIITTNIVGGLGNQLFLIANLLATATRNDLVPYVERTELSGSCHEPRPTYWATPLLAGLEASRIVCRSADEAAARCRGAASGAGGSASASASAAQLGRAPPTLVPELGPNARELVLPFGASSAPGRSVDGAAGVGDATIPATGAAAAPGHYSLVGFFQSDRYFSDVRSSLLPLLRPPELAAAAHSLLHRKQPPQQHAVALHVRRGDYLQLSDTFEILDHAYYCRALEALFGPLLVSRLFNMAPLSSPSPSPAPLHFGSAHGNAPLLRVHIFSEDEEYAKLLCGAIAVKYPSVHASVVVAPGARMATSADSSSSSASHSRRRHCISFDDEQVRQTGTGWALLPQDAKELLLMSACDDVVIANSSFSWWAAYLNDDTPHRRVVAPQRWFVGKPFPDMVHIYPSDWICI